MTKEEDFKLLKIQSCILKVNIDCDGCKQKVKKLLQRIDGVFQVSVDADQQKVTVSGNVDPATLIKKLVRAGKFAELWSQKGNQSQNQKHNCIKDEKNKKSQKKVTTKGLEGLKNQQNFPFLIPEEDEDCSDDEYDDEEDELRVMMERANQLGLLRQPPVNAKKAVASSAAGGGQNNGNNKGNAPKKGIPTPKKGSKGNPGGVDPKKITVLKNANLGRGGINNLEGNRINDLNAIMGLSAFPGNGTNIVGGTSDGIGGFQAQPNNGFQGSPASNGGYITGQYPSSMLLNMNGYNHPSAMTNFNMQNRHAVQQPQMMYQMSPHLSPNTGYYYDYGNPYLYSHHYPEANDSTAAHIFSDDNTGSCSIM